jgi:zinc transport system ATP-binding protein
MIEIKDLYFSYNKKPPYLLSGLNLNINKGDYVSIIGDNGSGKSTLVKTLLNINKPLKGSVSIHSSRIGYVPQRFDAFNAQFPITVYEILNSHRKAIGIKDLSEIKTSLDTVNMWEFNNQLIGNLSGGQQQKIFIARALMGNPELVILDEPSTGVDNQSQGEIYSIIRHLNRDHKITVVSIEHNLKAALKHSTHIFRLDSSCGRMFTIKEYKAFIQEENHNAAI